MTVYESNGGLCPHRFFRVLETERVCLDCGQTEKIDDVEQPMTDSEYDELRRAAKVILRLVNSDNIREVATFLAELEPYPQFIVTIEEVK